MNVVNRGIKMLTSEIECKRQELEIALPGVNLDSPIQLGKRLIELGYELPKTEKGNTSVDKRFFETYKHDPLIKTLIDYRTANKICGDFFIKVRDIQQYSCPEALIPGGERYGRLYPELNLFGANATGRFSSSCPNIQQIPTRNPEYGRLCRSMFVCTNKENKWIKADWASQEVRLQVHYANLIGAPGCKEIVGKFNADPKFDIHELVAQLARITRKDAKTINLGLSYGMGLGKLAISLGITVGKAKLLTNRYHSMVPYLKKLTEECQKRMIKNGCIKTINGRLLRREPGFEYKALNKLIQGSAADQCLEALRMAYNVGLDIKFPVHDELDIEGTEQDAKTLKVIMENCIETSVPMLCEIEIGDSWGNLTKIKDINEVTHAAIRL